MTSQAFPAPLSASARPSTGLLARLLATRADLAAPLLRLGLALVMWPHGAQKLLGWFGGYGYSGTMGFFTGTLGLPAPVGAATILLEFFGPLFLLVGLGTRAVAASFVGIMLGAILSVHAQHGFWMNWSGAQAGEGFEYHLLVIAMSLALVVRGGGSLSLDRRLAG